MSAKRDMTKDEYLIYIGDVDGYLYDGYIDYEELDEIPQVCDDYSEHESYSTLREWVHTSFMTGEEYKDWYHDNVLGVQ